MTLPLNTTTINNTSDIAQAEGALRAKVGNFLQKCSALAEEENLASFVAEAIRRDPKICETSMKGQFNGWICCLLGAACEHLDAHGEYGTSIRVNGTVYRKVAPTKGRAMTIFGEVAYQRSRYRPDGTGDAICPVEQVMGLAEGGMTPAATDLSLLLMGHLTSRESEKLYREAIGNGPSASSLDRLTRSQGECWSNAEDEALDALRRKEVIPDNAYAIQA